MNIQGYKAVNMQTGLKAFYYVVLHYRNYTPVSISENPNKAI